MQRTKSKVNSTKRVKEKARQTLNVKTSRDILSISGSEDIQMTSIPPNVCSPSPDAPSLVSSPQSSFLLPFGPYIPQVHFINTMFMTIFINTLFQSSIMEVNLLVPANSKFLK